MEDGVIELHMAELEDFLFEELISLGYSPDEEELVILSELFVDYICMLFNIKAEFVEMDEAEDED